VTDNAERQANAVERIIARGERDEMSEDVSERERLARALWLEFYDWTSSWEATDQEQWRASADVLIAAGFGDAARAATPSTVDTVEELRALPVGAVIWSDSADIAYQKTSHCVWDGPGEEYLDSGVGLPVAVLRMPRWS